MELRPYQAEAKATFWYSLENGDGNPCAVLPTGAGKTPLLAHMCRDVWREWGGRVLVLSHVKELVAQAEDKLRRVDPGLPVGLWCAGLNRKENARPVTVASIQSIYDKADWLDPLDLCIVDEAHLIPQAGDGMYRRFLADAKARSPHLRVAGLTATPYRMDSGWLCGPDRLLTHVCHETYVGDLVAAGYLARPVSVHGEASADLTGVRKVRGELDETEVGRRMAGTLGAAVAEIVVRAADRRSVLVFCAGVALAGKTAEYLAAATGDAVAEVYGDTPASQRDAAIKAFQAGKVRFLVNVNVLTTGFDAPNVDCVVLLRATLSPGLYYQMVGRGFRPHPSKEGRGFLVLDFGTNILRHGPVDAIRPKQPKDGPPGEAPFKVCENCLAKTAANARTCPQCGASFPPPKEPHGGKADAETPILSGNFAKDWSPRVDGLSPLGEKAARFLGEGRYQSVTLQGLRDFMQPEASVSVKRALLLAEELVARNVLAPAGDRPSRDGTPAHPVNPGLASMFQDSFEKNLPAKPPAPKETPKLETLDVTATEYAVHRKKGAPDDAPSTMRVTYWSGAVRHVSEWVCVEHDGFAAEKAAAWWRKRSADPMPRRAEDAAALASAGAVAETKQVTVRLAGSSKEFDRPVSFVLGPKPAKGAAAVRTTEADQCPF